MNKIRVPLRFRDMDDLGHLTHSVYHDFLAEGRVKLVETVIPKDAFPFVLANVNLNYRHEVRRADKEVVVKSSIARVGTKSVTIEQRLELTDGTLCAEGQATLVAWDGDARGARTLTDAEREGLANL